MARRDKDLPRGCPVWAGGDGSAEAPSEEELAVLGQFPVCSGGLGVSSGQLGLDGTVVLAGQLLALPALN